MYNLIHQSSGAYYDYIVDRTSDTVHPLVDRINDPRVARLVRGGSDETQGNPRRVSGFLKALDGDAGEAEKKAMPAESQSSAETASPSPKEEQVQSGESRKPRLLERITGLDKTSA